MDNKIELWVKGREFRAKESDMYSYFSASKESGWINRYRYLVNNTTNISNDVY